MLTLAILPADAAEVPQNAATFAAAGEAHLKRATTTTENQLDEFQSAHTVLTRPIWSMGRRSTCVAPSTSRTLRYAPRPSQTSKSGGSGRRPRRYPLAISHGRSTRASWSPSGSGNPPWASETRSETVDVPVSRVQLAPSWRPRSAAWAAAKSQGLTECACVRPGEPGRRPAALVRI